MKDPYQLIQQCEEHLKEFIGWQIQFEPTNDFRAFAKGTSNVQDAFKYAAILYPKFVLVENQVVLADHYEKEDWAAWRKTLEARDTANIVNHVHIEFYLSNDPDNRDNTELEGTFGELLAFFWSLAVKYQFPEKKVAVEYDGNVINVLNQE